MTTPADDPIAARRADPRYERLMAATRAAARNGYEAVSMRELAETCRMSMTTIYQFCQSKDHLIAEAHLADMDAFRRRLSARPPRAVTAEERVLQVMRSFAKALERDENLARALMRAMYSVDAGVGDVRALVGDSYAAMIDEAIGDEDIAGRDAIISTLGHVIDSVILGWLTRRHDTRWVRRELEAAVHALLGADDAQRAGSGSPVRAKHSAIEPPRNDARSSSSSSSRAGR